MSAQVVHSSLQALLKSSHSCRAGSKVSDSDSSYGGVLSKLGTFLMREAQTAIADFLLQGLPQQLFCRLRRYPMYPASSSLAVGETGHERRPPFSIASRQQPQLWSHLFCMPVEGQLTALLSCTHARHVPHA